MKMSILSALDNCDGRAILKNGIHMALSKKS